MSLINTIKEIHSQLQKIRTAQKIRSHQNGALEPHVSSDQADQ